MTEREAHAPTTDRRTVGLPTGQQTDGPAHPLAAAASPDSVHEGNGLLMTATFATRPLPRTPPAGERGRAWLDRLFAGEFPFPAVLPVPLPPGQRAAPEHDAVSRAAGCPDLFLIHADSPAGERAIADLARSAADRVLVLSPNPDAADRITERLLKLGVSVLRALADDENPVRPSPAVSKVTSASIGVSHAEQSRKEAAVALAAAEARVAAFSTVAKAIARLGEVNESLKRLGAEIADRTARRDRLEAEVRTEKDSPLACSLAKLQAAHDEAAARLAAELQALALRETVLAEARQRHAEATRKPGFFSRLFGARPKVSAAEAAELEKQLRAMEAEATAIASRVAELQAKREADAVALATEREKLIAAEVAESRGVLDAAIAAAESERARACAEAAALGKAIADAVPGEDHADAERQLTAARQFAAQVADTATEIASRAVAEARIVVGTPGSLEADPVFAGLPTDPHFDLLILDRAEELPEAEFPRLARLAERWVLVGDALPGVPRASANGRTGRNVRPGEVPFVTRLARLLDREAWTLEGDRFVCRLVHLTPEHRRAATREPLADRPEIELRFTDSDGEPLLAEIAFPCGTAVPDAKGFLFHTLGEVLLRPCGELHWQHAPDAILATWPAAGADGAWIDLEPGVRERVVGSGLFAYTAAVSFDPAAGWDAEKAQAWLAAHLPAPTGRFAALPRSHGPRHA